MQVRSGTEYSAQFRMAAPEDVVLEAYDHTKLSAVNTCVTWGIVRYQMHLVQPGGGRAMALEAGSAMHEVFAYVRLATLLQQLEEEDRDKGYTDKLWTYHGTRLFGMERLAFIQTAIAEADDIIDVLKRGSIAVLDSSGFHDDPRDKRRTLSNLEECAYAYVNRWNRTHRIWQRDRDDPTADIGIEIPFDLVCDVSGLDLLSFRLTGRIDGIAFDGLGRLGVEDNKTSSRLGDAWSMSQQVNHQFTGYCAAASVFTQQVVSNCTVIGLAIPLPKTYDFGGFMTEPMQRHAHHYARWLSWLVHTIKLTRQYANDPIGAPKYTHSCNRYFRPCSLIPFCYGDDDEQRAILEEMEVQEWSPLNKIVHDGVGDT